MGVNPEYVNIFVCVSSCLSLLVVDDLTLGRVKSCGCRHPLFSSNFKGIIQKSVIFQSIRFQFKFRGLYMSIF